MQKNKTFLTIIAVGIIILAGGLSVKPVSSFSYPKQPTPLPATASQEESNDTSLSNSESDLDQSKISTYAITPSIPDKADSLSSGEPKRMILKLGERGSLRPQDMQGNKEEVSSTLRIDSENVLHVAKYAPYVAVNVTAQELQKIRNNPMVQDVFEDEVYWLMLHESTEQIGAPVAWSSSYKGTGQTIAILDTGIYSAHPGFSGEKIVAEGCFSSSNPGITQSLCPSGEEEMIGPGSADIWDRCQELGTARCYHGTAVAGIAAGNKPDLLGVAPDATLIAVNIFSYFEQTDTVGAYASDIHAAMEYVYDLRNTHNIAAINLSLGTGGYTDSCDTYSYGGGYLTDTIAMLRSAGIATIMAAGNGSYNDKIARPSCISNAISVSTVTDGSSGETPDIIPSYANTSPLLDFLAPGEWINTYNPPDGQRTFRGTSASTPHVAGAWAVMRQRYPNASVEKIYTKLKSTAVMVTDTRSGAVFPRIQLDAALELPEEEKEPEPEENLLHVCVQEEQQGESLGALADWGISLRTYEEISEEPETRTIPAHSPTGVASSPLSAGVVYDVSVSGTWKNGSRRTADATTYSDDGWQTVHDLDNVASRDPRQLDLVLDDTDITWEKTGDHVYATTITGTGNPVVFRIFDEDKDPTKQAWYRDNTGTLTVNIIAKEQPQELFSQEGTTGEDGCVVFENISTGEYILSSEERDGWTLIKDPTQDGSISWVEGSRETYTFVLQQSSQPSPTPSPSPFVSPTKAPSPSPTMTIEPTPTSTLMPTSTPQPTNPGTLRIKTLICPQGSLVDNTTFRPAPGQAAINEKDFRPTGAGSVLGVIFDVFESVAQLSACRLATEDEASFSLAYHPEDDAGAGQPTGPQIPLDPPTYETDEQGEVILSSREVDGRYEIVVQDTDSILGFACYRNGEGHGHTANGGEYAILDAERGAEGDEGYCVLFRR